MQSSLSDFFKPVVDNSPAAVALRERIAAQRAEYERQQAAAAREAEEDELRQIAAEMELIASAKRKKDEERATRKAQAKAKRAEDLDKRALGVGMEVVAGVYLGNESASCNAQWLASEGVTHVLNCARECSGGCSEASEAIESLRLDLSDSASEDLASHLPQAVSFVSDALGAGGKVLVHCREGRSRSAAVVAAFLMQERRMALKDAVELMCDKCWQTSINEGFMRQLMDLEPASRLRRLLFPFYLLGGIVFAFFLLNFLSRPATWLTLLLLCGVVSVLSMVRLVYLLRQRSELNSRVERIIARRVSAARAAGLGESSPAMSIVNPLNFRLSLLDRDFTSEDYETLLALDSISTQIDAMQGNVIGAARPGQIAELPQRAFEAPPPERQAQADAEGLTVCAICLERYAQGESITTLPCLHHFHSQCIGRWLGQKSVCPVCKNRPFVN
eukprot:m51a1_g2601 putative dual specificity protein (446) ;mRNA; f:459067-461957